MTASYAAVPRRPDLLRLGGLPVHAVDVSGVHRFIEQVIAQHGKAVVANLNIHCASLAWRYPWLRDFLEAAQLVFCDGDGIRWGLRLLGTVPPPKITYDRWIWQLAEFASTRGYRFYFLGAKPGVAHAAADRLRQKLPELQVLGTHHGHFDKQGNENTEVLAEINRFKPDILVIGFGMPLQEKWINDHWEQLDVHVFLPAGAVFDYASGRLARAPQWIIRLQMEWFYRLLQDPGRLFGRYVLENPKFFLRLLMERLRRRPLP